MKEDFLYYVWQFKKFELSKLRTVEGDDLQILNSGQFSGLSGPDFFNARLVIGDQVWAGNVEMHLNSSDWYVHNHEQDSAYDNVILHVVWQYNTPVFRGDNTPIPTLEIKKYVSADLVSNYQSLIQNKSWINCEKFIGSVDSFLIENWIERLFLERLEQKTSLIYEEIERSKGDWEAVLFVLLAKNFGLHTNGFAFFEIAKSIPFDVVRKEANDLLNLEAIFLGQAQILEKEVEDVYFKDHKSRYAFLAHKYQLLKTDFISVQFFKVRPDNFPTIRLSQLAQLYHINNNLFTDVVKLASAEECYNLFQVKSSEYWQTHYTFGKESTLKVKKVSKSFVDLLIINTIIPIQFAYFHYSGQGNVEQLISFIKQIVPEENTVVGNFQKRGFQSKSAMDSQSLLQLKSEYCAKLKCLSCAIGVEVLRGA